MKNKNITINVTQNDIDNGCSVDGLSCPVALAIKRKTGRNIEVAEDFLFSADIGSYCKSIKTPPKVKEFVRNFDFKKEVKPFRFSLNIGKLS